MDVESRGVDVQSRAARGAPHGYGATHGRSCRPGQRLLRQVLQSVVVSQSAGVQGTSVFEQAVAAP